MRALNLLRESLHYRRDAFDAGLQAVGFELVRQCTHPEPGDVLVIWNRYGGYHDIAAHFEHSGGHVVVAENGYLGKEWQGGNWYALALGHHAGAGQWHVGGPERWDRMGVELERWRDGQGDIVILGQRGIGEPGIASPYGWAEAVQRRIGGRIRPHPGQHAPAVPMRKDFSDARAVVTWHSGAALHALLMGVPVFYGFPQWIGAEAGRPLDEFEQGPRYGDRLAMFRRLAWAQWTLDEIRTGDAFAHLLGVACAS